jgi:hypothetical protein
MWPQLLLDAFGCEKKKKCQKNAKKTPEEHQAAVSCGISCMCVLSYACRSTPQLPERARRRTPLAQWVAVCDAHGALFTQSVAARTANQYNSLKLIELVSWVLPPACAE